MNNINQLLKQAQQLQAKLAESQNKLNDLEITGSSGGGMVHVTINGKCRMKKIHFDPKLLSDGEAEIVCDLILAAHSDAMSKLETKMSEEMGNLMPSGMKLPF
ncbi:MAG: YbaB/EbfC family nucleoid-associated protein [Holosporaceae bacterium]|jgi:DNA-binding YbaB/EbfC family protein|nr:YbaB/EbfC family nucleoid-associated protein [Holosporaceae bacterium]